jgi:hypothetical protein
LQVIDQGLDLRPEIRDFVLASRIGEPYRSVRYVHDINTFGSERASEIKGNLLRIAEILEDTIHEANSDDKLSSGYEKARKDIHHVVGDIVISQNQQGAATSLGISEEELERRRIARSIGPTATRIYGSRVSEQCSYAAQIIRVPRKRLNRPKDPSNVIPAAQCNPADVLPPPLISLLGTHTPE